MQELPGAPGTARQGRTGTNVPATRGGVATQPRAPGHGRPPAAPRAAGHGRLSAATGAPGADVPLATTARAPGQHCLSAVPRAPGHGRPLAALSAARHDRPCATLRAPGADVPPATPAGAPGQHRLSAVAIATAALPAGVNRPRQGVLPRVPANPRTLIYPRSQSTAASFSRQRESSPHPHESRNPPLSTWWRGAGGEARPVPLRSGGPTGGPVSRPSHAHTDLLSHHTTHQVHPAVQVPPRPRSCSTADTGLSLHHPSRAPPPRHCGAGRNPAERPPTL